MQANDVSEKVGELGESAQAMLSSGRENLGELGENAKAMLEQGKENLGNLDAYVRDTVRRYPGVTLFAFLTFGYAVGRLVARR